MDCPAEHGFVCALKKMLSCLFGAPAADAVSRNVQSMIALAAFSAGKKVVGYASVE